MVGVGTKGLAFPGAKPGFVDTEFPADGQDDGVRWVAQAIFIIGNCVALDSNPFTKFDLRQL